MNQHSATGAALSLDPDLRAALMRVARVPQLLVACDYDGTLAPIVADPTRATPESRSRRRDPCDLLAPPDHGRRDLRPGPARPGRTVPAAGRGPPGRQPRVRVRRRLRRRAAARAPPAAHRAAGRPDRDRQGPARRTAGGQARQHRRAHPSRAARRRPADLRRRPQRRRALAGHRDDHRQGGHRAVRRPDRQGAGRRRPAHAGVGQRRGLPRRRLHRREGLRPPARPRPRHQGRPRRDRGQVPHRGRRGGARRARAAPADPAAVALRRAGGADRAALDAVQLAHRGAAHPGRPGHLAVPPAPGRRRGLRRPARRRRGRALHGVAGARRAAARPALPAGHDDRGDALVGPDRHGLAGLPPDRQLARSACCPARRRRASTSCRAPSSARSTAGSSGSTPAWSCSARPSRSSCTPPASTGRSTSTATATRPAPWSTSTPAAARSCSSCGWAPTTRSRRGSRRPSGRSPPRPSGASGPTRSSCPRSPATRSGAARSRCAGCGTSRPARSWPRRPLRCRRRWAARATGTTGTAGCATPRCRPRRWSTSARPRRPSRWCAGRCGSATRPRGTRSGCTRCTRWRAPSSVRRRSSTRCPATPAPGRCASATPPTGRCSSTSSGRSPT